MAFEVLPTPTSHERSPHLFRFYTRGGVSGKCSRSCVSFSRHILPWGVNWLSADFTASRAFRPLYIFRKDPKTARNFNGWYACIILYPILWQTPSLRSGFYGTSFNSGVHSPSWRIHVGSWTPSTSRSLHKLYTSTLSSILWIPLLLNIPQCMSKSPLVLELKRPETHVRSRTILVQCHIYRVFFEVLTLTLSRSTYI